MNQKLDRGFTRAKTVEEWAYKALQWEAMFNDQPEMGGIGKTSFRYGVNLFKVVQGEILS